MRVGVGFLHVERGGDSLLTYCTEPYLVYPIQRKGREGDGVEAGRWELWAGKAVSLSLTLGDGK